MAGTTRALARPLPTAMTPVPAASPLASVHCLPVCAATPPFRSTAASWRHATWGLAATISASGSGKTTTLMMIAGFTPPSAGDVLLDGRSIAGLAPERRNIGVVFQNYALFPHMSVADNVGFPLKMRSEARSVVEEKVRGALRLVRLEGL